MREMLRNNNFTAINYVEPVLVYVFGEKDIQTDNDNIEVIRNKNIFNYFTKSMPIRKSDKFNEEEMGEIVSVIKREAKIKY